MTWISFYFLFLKLIVLSSGHLTWRMAGKREYMPKYRSGAFAIILTLYEHTTGPGGESIGKLTKDEIIEKGQKHTDKSFKSKPSSRSHRDGVSKPSDYYSAWSCMSELVKKRGIVEESWTLQPRKKVFHLSEKGITLGERLSRWAKEREETTNENDSGPDKDSPIEDFLSNRNLEPLSDDLSMFDLTKPSSSLSPSLNQSLHQQTSKRTTSFSPICLSSPSSGDEGFDQIDLLPPRAEKRTERRATGKRKRSEDSSEGQREKRESRENPPPPPKERKQGEPFYLSPEEIEEYELILVADQREHMPGRGAPISQKLRELGVNCQLKTLSLGDFLWGLKKKRPGGRSEDGDPQYFINTVFERKTLSDLWMSVLDGRLKEQEIRLRRTGFQIIYILEGEMSQTNNNNNNNNHYHRSGPIDPKVLAGIQNDLWLKGILMHGTTGAQQTVLYLSCLEKVLEGQIRREGVKAAWEFGEFQKNFQHSKKMASVGSTWVRMLLQIPGLGSRKAMAIYSAFPTLSLLIEEYSRVGEEKGKGLLQDLRSDEAAQRVGPHVSRVVYEMLMLSEYPEED